MLSKHLFMLNPTSPAPVPLMGLTSPKDLKIFENQNISSINMTKLSRYFWYGTPMTVYSFLLAIVAQVGDVELGLNVLFACNFGLNHRSDHWLANHIWILIDPNAIFTEFFLRRNYQRNFSWDGSLYIYIVWMSTSH